MAEKATLYEVEEDGETLVLLDGRRFTVSPSHTSVVLGWSPTTRLTLSKNNNLVFRIAVKNENSGQVIAARPTSRRPARSMQRKRRRPF
jgi:hypothetical protein